MTILAHDVQAKQPERDALQAKVDAWVAKNGQPPCYGPEVSAAAGGDHYATRLAETSAAKRRKGKG
jgi:hypothetical protein